MTLSLDPKIARFALASSMLLCAACDTAPHEPVASQSAFASPRSGAEVRATPSECTAFEPGCACEAGTPAKTCFPQPGPATDGTLKCARGTISCRDGTWSSCESLTSFVIKEPAGAVPKSRRLGTQTQALISKPTVCNACSPSCFAARDRPTDVDLVIGNSSQVVYDSTSAGVSLQSEVDISQRGPANTPAECGNGIIEGVEVCDDKTTTSGDGCTADCRLEEGWHCPAAGSACRRSVCGDSSKEGTEQCDDGNLQIGDGCTPFCALEPTCSGGVCQAVCGDGKVLPGEICDDGNTRDGDGCSALCTLEVGFRCDIRSPTPPQYMDLPIVYRDLRSGHPDFEHWCCGMDLGMVQSRWGTDRKPVPVIALNPKLPISSALHNPSLSTVGNFQQWYHDDPAANMTYADRLRVTREKDGTYAFDTSSFFPLTGRGFTARGEPERKDNKGKQNNFHFTSEVRFWFQYQRGQVLTFRGDDDVWVFINGQLAVDLGGVHGATPGSVTLGAATEATYALTPGGLYEAAVFQAERHTTESNYRLQLGGFFFGRTECTSVCGDGIVTNNEICDDGRNDGKAGGCKPNCLGRVPRFAASGNYWRNYDATETCAPREWPVWGDLAWQASTPGSSDVRFEVRSAATPEQVMAATPVGVDLSSVGDVASVNVGKLLGPSRGNDPYLRVTAILKPSKDETEAPVLREFDLTYHCSQEE